jgi:ribosome-associated protein
MEQPRIPITIHTPFVTLGQMLKIADVISSGGEAKSYLAATSVLVDGVSENRRGRKLYPGAVVTVGNQRFEIVSA